MLSTPEKVISGLKTLNDCYYLKSKSIVYANHDSLDSKYREPFRKGFLSEADKRFELIKRLNKLDDRERKILLLFYTFSVPIDHIAEEVGVSRRHCYRIKKKGIENITGMDGGRVVKDFLLSN